jgi:hypothetical protein
MTYVQPGTELMQASGVTNSPTSTTVCPYCGLTARRVGSAKFEWICDNAHQFALSATGSGDLKLLDASDIGPISMGGE